MTTDDPKQLELPMDVPGGQQPSSTKSQTQPGPRQWLEWAALEWQAFHQRQMTVRWPRDVTLIKPLLRQHGPAELAARWSTYVRTPDEFLARRGWNVPSFSMSIDRYAGNVDYVEVVRDWNRSAAPQRDPLTGALRR